MTEEIIIDGVNVAECDFYQIEANELYPKAQYCGSMRNTFCENEPNCYYKQLKRLEKRNFELEESLKVFNRPDVNRVLTLYKVGDIDLLEKKCDRLEQENKELKDNDCEKCKHLDLYMKYKSALEEIREIVNEPCIEDEDCETCDSNCMCKEILDKINEVLQCE